MARSAASRVLVGPHGLHAFGLAAIAGLIVFLWIFNFTNFF